MNDEREDISKQTQKNDVMFNAVPIFSMYLFQKAMVELSEPKQQQKKNHIRKTHIHMYMYTEKKVSTFNTPDQ